MADPAPTTPEQSVGLEILSRGRFDFVLAPEVAEIVREVFGTRNEDEVRETSCAVVHCLLSYGLIEAGMARVEGFECWEDSADAIVARIESEWRLLQRPPVIGDLFWLRNTPAGDSFGGS